MREKRREKMKKKFLMRTTINGNLRKLRDRMQTIIKGINIILISGVGWKDTRESAKHMREDNRRQGRIFPPLAVERR
jgi:hypothetical protein